MITDITGMVLTPGNNGLDCLGNGNHTRTDGSLIECCCDECNFLVCCTLNPNNILCQTCTNIQCHNYSI